MKAEEEHTHNKAICRKKGKEKVRRIRVLLHYTIWLKLKKEKI